MATADTVPVTVVEREGWFREFSPDRRPLWVDDDARGLDDSEVGVINRGKHRVRESSTMDDAADPEAVVLVGVARLAALQAAAPLDGNRPGLCGARRQTPIWRIDH